MIKASTPPAVVLLIWLEIVLAGVWVGLDARKYRIALTNRPYSGNNGALAAGLSGVVVFFGTQLLMGIWVASALWFALFLDYVVRRYRYLTGRLQPSAQSAAATRLPPLPALPPPEPPVEVAQPVAAPSGQSDTKAKTQSEFVKGACQHCAKHLEFDAQMTGQTIECPHCKQKTKLVQGFSSGGTCPKPAGKVLPVGIPIGRSTPPSSSRTQPGQRP
jgi:hypothetical protein